MSAAVMAQTGIHNVMDAINPPTSFSARKNAVSNMPVPGRIDLPINPVTQKFNHSLPQLSQQQQQQQTQQQQQQQQHGSIGSLLTPPSNISGESLSPISSAASSAARGVAGQGLPPFTPSGSWSGPSGTGLTPIMSAGTGTTSQSWGSSLSFPPPRNLFSPLGNLIGTASSPVKSEALPPPPYNMNDLNLPPFPTSNASLATTMAQQQPLPSAHSHMAYMSMSQAPLTTAALSNIPQQPGPISPSDSYLRAPLTPATSYYGSQPSGTPMQSTFPFSSTSPPAISPPPRISPMTSSAGSHFPPPPPPAGTPGQLHQQQFAPPRPFQPYGMPPMGMISAPPNGHLTYPFNSGAAAAQQMRYHDQNGYPHPGSMLGAPSLAHNERPFKCDQCPQSFNRNHDLKRHKRIHLAVKPFPCEWCDKSFSRKDALKRHILVKGCGKAGATKDCKLDDTDAASAKSESEGEGSRNQSG